MDELPPGAGWGVAGLTLLVGLVREYVRGRDQHAVAREQGAAAVVPELLERLDGQDATIAQLRDGLAAAQRGLADCQRQHDESSRQMRTLEQRYEECAAHRADDAERMADAVARADRAERTVEAMSELVEQLARASGMRTPVPPAPEPIVLGPVVSRPPPLPAHIRSTREEPSE